MIPYPVTFGELDEKWQQKLEVQIDDIEDLAVPIFCGQLALRVFLLDRNELIGIDTASMVPHGVILRVGLEELRRLL